MRAQIVLACLLSSAASAADDQARSESLGRASGWREAYQCGPNALYMLMKLEGWDGDLEGVRNQVKARPGMGCSLLELRDAGRHFGFPFDVLATDVEGLAKLGRPAVVHMDRSGGQTTGHYEIFLHVGEARNQSGPIALLHDPIALREYEFPLGQFERCWTGYVLSSRARPPWAQKVATIAFGAAPVVGMLVLGFLWTRRRVATASSRRETAQAEASCP